MNFLEDRGRGRVSFEEQLMMTDEVLFHLLFETSFLDFS